MLPPPFSDLEYFTRRSKNLCTCQFQALTVLYSINAEGHRVEISFNEIPPRIEINPQPQRLLITPQVDKTTCA